MWRRSPIARAANTAAAPVAPDVYTHLGSHRCVAPTYNPQAIANPAATATVAAVDGAIIGRPPDVGTTACWPRRPPAAQ
jgi:hypothetical protein